MVFIEPQAAHFSQTGTNCRPRLAVWYIQGPCKSSKSGLEGSDSLLYQSAALAGKSVANHGFGSVLPTHLRRGARVVEWGGLENR